MASSNVGHLPSLRVLLFLTTPSSSKPLPFSSLLALLLLPLTCWLTSLARKDRNRYCCGVRCGSAARPPMSPEAQGTEQEPRSS